MHADALLELFQRFRPEAGLEALPAALSVPDTAAHPIRMMVFDFDGVFTDNAVWVSQSGEESVRCSRIDGYGLQLLPLVGVMPLVLSGEVNPVVSARCRKLKLACVQGVLDKAPRLEALAEEHDIPLSAMAYVGNDVNDIPCFERVGVPITVADAHPMVLPAVNYVTKAKGGHGAVREVCEWVFYNRLEAGCLVPPEKATPIGEPAVRNA